MTIKQMFEREDIYTILESTLKRYYKIVHNQDVFVLVKKRRIISSKILIYPRLGMIFSSRPSIEVIKNCYTAFDVKENLIKKIVAWTYITVCLLTFGLFSHRQLYISEDSLFDSSTLILPCNRKIRIFNFKKGYVDAILKDGFNDKFYHNEIFYRENLHYDFIPKLNILGVGCYREKILDGRCLVRTGADIYKKSSQDVIMNLTELVISTQSFQNYEHYINKLYNDNIIRLQQISKLKHICCYEKFVEYAKWEKTLALQLKTNIPIALTHGDLQTGNVWVDVEKQKTYLIDWETADLRSIWYDCCVLLLSIRRKNKFSYMVNNCLEKEIIDAVFAIDSCKNYNMGAIMGILLLEELSFFTEEILDLPGGMGSEIIERHEYELGNIDWDRLNQIGGLC